MLVECTVADRFPQDFKEINSTQACSTPDRARILVTGTNTESNDSDQNSSAGLFFHPLETRNALQAHFVITAEY